MAAIYLSPRDYKAVLRVVGITLKKFFVFRIDRQLGLQLEHGLGYRALGECHQQACFVNTLLIAVFLSSERKTKKME